MSKKEDIRRLVLEAFNIAVEVVNCSWESNETRLKAAKLVMEQADMVSELCLSEDEKISTMFD